ncbi:winged helix-turn-helix domain-containing protein [Salsipaludibacter albus]|uniref:winged helix-turn-helix domain-containing protein n=1 Tax=Salsipaludibacter albus TaxID=2849650 RepID=UPI001EE48F04|nr:winged helix-turn-helix domain-containing protein [Salsipaludibacter albus]MBY5163274.1 winged helix-turn-helix domain-containing protein [Salsipaludibacter albus]
MVAFGQEFGRVLSDGQIVGRAEPFAKVFASSRGVKRAVGVMAWAILEDIALDARLDVEGRLVADTHVRRIADNVGLSKNTVAKHLARLRDNGFVLHEEHRADDSGYYSTSRYVLDPSACLERFTHTPTTDVVHSPVENSGSTDRTETASDDGFGPCTNSWDTVAATVSQSVGHRGLGHNNKEVVVPEEKQQQAESDVDEDAGDTARLRDDLVALGIPADRARQLVDDHGAARVADAVAAAHGDGVRSPAGWVVAALTRGWEIPATDSLEPQPSPPRRPTPPPVDEPGDDDPAPDVQARRGDVWAAAAAELLDDETLACFVAAETRGPLAGFALAGPRLLRARIAGRLAAAHLARPDLSLPDAIDAARPRLADLELPGELPPCPHQSPDASPAALDVRLAVAAGRSPQPADAGVSARS